MIRLPLEAILFWIAVTLAPQDTLQILVKGPDATFAWTKQKSGWSFSSDRSLWATEGEAVTLAVKGKEGKKREDVGKYVQGVKGHDWKQSATLKLPPNAALGKEGETFVYTLDEGATTAKRYVIRFRRTPEGFGPVIERTLSSLTEQRPIKGENLDSGREIDLPADVQKEAEERFHYWLAAAAVGWPAARGGAEQQIFHWLAANGVDLMAYAHSGGWDLWTSMKMASVDAAYWDRSTAADLQAALQLGAPRFRLDTSHSLEGFASYWIRANARFPLSFVVQTQANGVGILQITAFSDSPKGMKIRYKMCPAAGVPPKELEDAVLSQREKGKTPGPKPPPEEKAKPLPPPKPPPEEKGTALPRAEAPAH